MRPRASTEDSFHSTCSRKDSRFKVSRTTEPSESSTGELNGSDETCPLVASAASKSGSEPPVSAKAMVERKISSTGRFQVSTDANGSSPEGFVQEVVDETTGLVNGTPLGTESVDATPTATITTPGGEPVRARGVHFSVGDKDQDEKREYSTENNTTVNLKSWRNMKTLEHPPIMDFYRNSFDDDNITARPSMAQLIHGGKSIPEDMEIEDFTLHNDELVEGQVQAKPTKNKTKVEKFNPPQQQARVKFGWIQGVFVRCMLNIFGVMLYLRISWVAGQAGIGLGCGIVLLAALVTTITAISTCAICTNGDVKGGGAYYLISRSLGPEFGGSIGLIFCIANAVGAAMYVVGFAETIRDLFKAYDVRIVDQDIWDVRIVGVITCVVLMGIVFIGTGFESKMQMGLLGVLLVSLVNYWIGSLIPPSDAVRLKGATGYSITTAIENFLPDFRDNEDFFSVFSVYFPAATGIMAGANISGDLADPQKAIPIGTLLAIAFCTVVYVATVIMTGSSCVRYADGVNMPLFNGTTFIQPDCAVNNTCQYGLMNYFQAAFHCRGRSNDDGEGGRPATSRSFDDAVLEMESLIGPLITAGIFAATLSSALASLVSAPKVFQAVCKDRLFPKIGYFAKAYGKDEEPRRAYFLVFIIAVAMSCIGDLNAIAPIISNFFLASYTLINYACFDQSFADSPGFRPSFKYYNMWVSLAGSILCIIVMFIISWSTALITFLCFAALFLYLLHRRPEVNWGSSTQAHSYKNALASMIKLSNTEEHVKNYRPQLLVLCGNPASRPSLVDFVNNITKGNSLMICGYVVPYQPSDRIYSVIRKLDRQVNEWLHKRHVKSFYAAVANPSLRAGTRALLQISGLGKLRPNIVIIGFKANWYFGGPSDERLADLNEYFGTIQDAFDSNMGMCILRNSTMGLDFSEAMKQLNVGEHKGFSLTDVKSLRPNTVSCPEKLVADPELYADGSTTMMKDGEKTYVNGGCVNGNGVNGSSNDIDRKLSEATTAQKSDQDDDLKDDIDDGASSTSLSEQYFNENDDDDDQNDESNDVDKHDDDEDDEDEDEDEDLESGHPYVSDMKRPSTFSLRRRNSRRPTMEQRALLASMARFNRKVKKGVIDVWWLYDDGGLTLLIPHLLTIPKSYLEGSKLRVFTISTSSRTMEQEQRNMAALLSKFRIDFSDVSVIADIGRKPKKETMSQWERLIEKFIAPDGDCPTGMTTQSELDSQKEKTYRQLRTAELLEEHSSQADLVVLTLPVPRKGLVSASLYLSWLDMMTRGLPPTLLVRGNQHSVLTFYS